MSAAVLYVKDLERMRAFYETCFGMVARQPEDGGACVLKAAASELTLVRVPPSIAARLEITDPPRPREDSALKLVFDVADLDATRVAVLAAGGHVEPSKSAWNFQGHRHQDVCDPEGNVTQLRQRLVE
jgi:predicted enzyme related to lactoylglutathione lyase